MVKKMILAAFALLPMFAKAQLLLTAQLPPAGFVQKEQLWNLMLVNNKEDLLDITLQMNLQDALTGQIVLSATTGNLLIGKGMKNITAKDLQPILYNYNLPDIPKSYLPLGSYIACYQVIGNGRKTDALAQECISFNIDPLSPPLLNMPADKSEITTPYPQFSWMPPAPYDMFTNLSYDILLAEVLDGQSSTEAIQYNTPIYSKGDITQPFDAYNSSFTKLDTGKIYAWQVVAKNGLSYAAKTEVWTFKLAKENVVKKPVHTNYILLDNNVQGIYTVNRDTLHVKYVSASALREYDITFTDERDEVVRQLKQKIRPGDNYLDLPMGHEFTRGRVYKMIITGPGNNKHSLRFNINKN